MIIHHLNNNMITPNNNNNNIWSCFKLYTQFRNVTVHTTLTYGQTQSVKSVFQNFVVDDDYVSVLMWYVFVACACACIVCETVALMIFDN